MIHPFRYVKKKAQQFFALGNFECEKEDNLFTSMLWFLKFLARQTNAQCLVNF